MDSLAQILTVLQFWIFDQCVQPLLSRFGLEAWSALALDGAKTFVLGATQILLAYVLLRPLEAWRPAEAWADRRAVRVDVIYTLIHRLGLVPLLIFAALAPLVGGFESWLSVYGIAPPNLDDIVPALRGHPWWTLAAYLLILDLGEYVRHRLQHRYNWWWALHAVHHSQRQLSLWADDRSHLLDDLLAGLWSAGLALLIGTPPEQFALIVVVTKLAESFAHTNVRMHLGSLGERLLVSPSYHRTHHAISAVREGAFYCCNFAVLFPIWDVLFGSANFSREFPATGIGDQLMGRDYGETFWRQQWLGLKRLAPALKIPRIIRGL
jgi:sterol desaturase/sphingolipid hydroxylase (fatty acid hydroxylase superfamily)